MQNSYKPEGHLINTARNIELTSSLQGLEYAMQHDIILEGLAILCDGKYALHINLGDTEGVIPREESTFNSDGSPIKDIAIITRVGKPVCFKVKNIENHGGRVCAVLSRKDAQKDCFNNYIMKLTPGDIIPSQVTHLEGFGAFVDIGCGIPSLLSVDCISVSRISHPSDRLICGDNIITIVKSIDRNTGRVCVSQRELLGTWEENASRFSVGQTVAGIIRSIETYGIFVELTPNLAGLAEIREHGASSRSIEPGQCAAVYIKNIIPEKMKIKLVLIDTYKTKVPVPPLEYFIDTNTVSHIDRWCYSPKSSTRIIESVF